jgi:hypothetical protein
VLCVLAPAITLSRVQNSRFGDDSRHPGAAGHIALKYPETGAPERLSVGHLAHGWATRLAEVWAAARLALIPADT